jgi:hypothetical protein
VLQQIATVTESPNVTVWTANTSNAAGRITQKTLVTTCGWATAGALTAQIVAAGYADFGIVGEAGVLGDAEEGAAAAEEETIAGAPLNVNPLGGSMNCVNCAVATEATLSGNPASALLSGPQPISVLGGDWQPVSGEMQVGSILSESGSGAQGIVYG